MDSQLRLGLRRLATLGQFLLLTEHEGRRYRHIVVGQYILFHIIHPVGMVGHPAAFDQREGFCC